MPPTTRKSTRGAGAGTGAKQSTLSFNHRVTKNVAKAGKDLKPAPPSPVIEIPEKKQQEEHDGRATTPSTTAELISPITKASVQDQAVEKSEAELKAAKISDAAVRRYWEGIESSRRAKEVHKKHGEGLTVGEKVLRYFDVSSQYGPCIGITRLKRWKRAERLGLKPPIEVLAALIKEEERIDGRAERAHMDELMSSTAVGAV